MGLGGISSRRSGDFQLKCWLSGGIANLNCQAAERIVVERRDEVTYSSLGSGYDSAGQWSRALGLISELRSSGLEPFRHSAGPAEGCTGRLSRAVKAKWRARTRR